MEGRLCVWARAWTVDMCTPNPRGLAITPRHALLHPPRLGRAGRPHPHPPSPPPPVPTPAASQFVAPAATPAAAAFVDPAKATTPAVPAAPASPPPADLTPDVAGDPIPVVGPPIAEEDVAPLDSDAKAPEGLVQAAAAPSLAPKKNGPEKSPLPASDVTYAATARRATLDPAGGKLTLESVSPVVAGIRVQDGARTGRRSTAARFFGATLVRNGTWLGSPSAVLYGTLDATRSGGGKSEVVLPLRLTAATYSSATGAAVLRAAQLDGPWNATVTGGLSNGVLDAAAERGAALKADRRLTLLDPLLIIDAVYSRPEYKLEG